MSNYLDSYDCVIIGGGPAGTTAAALIADAGHSVLLLDRDKMPRAHIGESLMPETYWIFERLGLLEKMKQSSFPKKVGVQFVSSGGKESQPFYFRNHDPRECSETWHVERAEFDQMLMENARSKGADCREGVRVTEVLFQTTAAGTQRATGVVLAEPSQENSPQDKNLSKGKDEKSLKTILARVVIDATGQQTMLASKLGLLKINPEFRKASIWAHFKNGTRNTDGGGVKTSILHSNDKKSWFWYIPQSDNLVSVGMVGDLDYLLNERLTPEEIFAREMKKCPGIIRRLKNATVTEPYQMQREFSYSTTQSSGDGWVLVGDAWGFIDPVYSSGVYFAMKSAELAADAISAGLRKNDTSSKQIGSWIPSFTASSRWIYKLVQAFYTPEFRVGKFAMQHPEHQQNLTNLLIGRIFTENAGQMFGDLETWIEKQRAETTH